MAEFFNIPTENLHDAKYDVKTTIEIIKKMKNLTKGNLVNK
jgi:exonuclease I